MSAVDERAGCGAEHPHIDVRCNHHKGDGRHRFVDEWGTLDSWPIGQGEPGAERAPATVRQRLTLIGVGTLLAAAVAIGAFMMVAAAGSLS